MRHTLKGILITASLVFCTSFSAVQAADIALIITNGNYTSANSRAVTRTHVELQDAYAAQGYEIIEGRNMDAQAMRGAIQSFYDRMDGKDRMVVHISARVVSFGDESWVLPVDVAADSLLDVAYNAPSLNVLLELLGQNPGRGMLFLGKYAVGETQWPLEAGLGAGDIPQGVLLVQGPETDISKLVKNNLLDTSVSLQDALSGVGGRIQVMGFASPDVSLTKLQDAPAPENGDGDWVDLLAEQTLWAVADKSNREADLREYLRRFPNGIFAPAATARLEKLVAPAEPSAAELEATLRLSRAERRKIQKNLTMLGYDTRGIDGIFGRGSRRSIARWQQDQQQEGSGFLTAGQVNDLNRQADTRRAEIEIADRRYWNATGLTGDKDDLELYLAKYPDGVFAPDAKAALAEITAAETESDDEDAWTDAVALNSADSYRDYLSDFPSGIYSEIARQRVERLDPNPTPAEEVPVEESNSAKDQENRLKLNAATRLLIENRLRTVGHDPGNVDGAFTSKTRQAIKGFQRSRGLNATGYIDPQTVRALLLG